MPTLKYRNIVYVDLSNNRQVQVYRKTWDLGFYCGDEFRVILNSAYKTLAAGSGKTDFAAVTLEDADAAPSLLGSMMGDSFEKNADDTSGDLAKTVFGEIAADGEVFFVASEDNKTTDGVEDRTLWYKVKVSRGEAGYKVEYGKVGDTSPKVVEIAKDPLYGFIGFSLASGEQVEAQPRSEEMGPQLVVCRSLVDDEFGTDAFVLAGCHHDQPAFGRSGRHGHAGRG